MNAKDEQFKTHDCKHYSVVLKNPELQLHAFNNFRMEILGVVNLLDAVKGGCLLCTTYIHSYYVKSREIVIVQ